MNDHPPRPSCPVCDTPWTPKPSHPNQRYCSTRCRRTGWQRRAKGLPENGVANGADGTNAAPNGAANGVNAGNGVANGEGVRAVAACPHCRQPISLITLIVPPAAAFVTVPDPPTTATHPSAPTHHRREPAHDQ
ncbi:MAG: hypothetical protein ACRD0H_25500 [Actinomycetes bacterium]